MNIQSLKTKAADRLHTAPYSPGRLALIHTGVAVALSVLITLLNYLLTSQIQSTAGLSGIGTRAILLSAQEILTIVTAAAMPFWSCGFLRAALLISRNETATPTTLLEGFRRFGPVLRLNLIRTVTCLVIGFVTLQAASMIFMLTPLSNDFMESALALMATGSEITDAALDGLMSSLWAVYVLWIVLAGVVLIPMFYRYRMADFSIMDEADRALKAFAESKRLMFCRRRQLFKLDLHFWWYYALQVVALAVAYGDTLLPALGVTVDPNVAFFGFYLVSQAIQLALAWRFAPLVQTTYAAAYNEFKELADRQFELRIEN